MPFDLATAKPDTPAKGGFDLSTAKPVGGLVTSAQIPRDKPGDPNYRVPTAQDMQRDAELSAPTPSWRDDNLLGNVVGLVEAPLTLATGAAAAVPAGLAALYNFATSGAKNAGEAGKQAEGAYGAVADAFTYRPRTGTGSQLAQMAGQAMAPLVGVPTAQLLHTGQGIASSRSALRQLAGPSSEAMAVQDAAMVQGGGRVRDLIQPPRALAGVGAARSPEITQRVERAASMPVPMKLTKAMQTRNLDDVQFEQTAKKTPGAGEPLRNRDVELNQGILQNLDAFADLTGAEGTGLRATGKVVNDALIKKVARVKGEIRNAYDEAAQSAEGSTPAPYADLAAFLEKHKAEADTGNAPVLNAVRASLEKLDPEGSGVIPLKEYNEIREMVGRVSKDGTPNAAYRAPLQELVDSAVEEHGGPLYRQARRQYANYINEFKNAAVIDKMLRTKPGTTDRAVALEDIVDHAILKAQSLDDTRKVRRTLQTAGKEGEQAWKELQGESLRQIKEQMTKAAALDESGNRNASAAVLDKVVRDLDADGRLEFVYGKQGAQKLRDLRDIALDVKTIPAGMVSTSGSGEVILAAMDTIMSGFTGLPLPIGTALNYGVKRAKNNKLKKRVNEALNPGEGE